MATKTDISNLALSHVGVGKSVASFDTENSNEASSCRTFYQMALEETLRDFAWPFATVIAPLPLVAATPNTEWGYAYRYPTDCIKIRRILSGNRNDTRQSRVAYKLSQDAGGILILTDQISAQLEYTVRVANEGYFPSDFTMAISLRLAFYIAPRVTGGDPFKMGDRAMRLYEVEVDKAKANAANEEQPDELPDSEFINARN